ncbi:MAG: T9SS type A sorting domain-containing protein, partial [Bacteroidota bacterium]
FWYDSFSINVITDINEELTNLPKEFSLGQNYPNPFNPSTKIKYSIPNRTQVTLKVFDVLGSEIITLVNKEQTAGYYAIEFDASNLTSGIYFYRVQAGQFVETKKMILLR